MIKITIKSIKKWDFNNSLHYKQKKENGKSIVEKQGGKEKAEYGKGLIKELSDKNKNLEEKIETFKNFGIKNAEEVIQVGMNAKMNEFSAIMGILNLEKVDNEILKRKRLVDKYCELLRDVKGITILDYVGDYKRNYAYFPILVDKEVFGISRDCVSDELKKHNIFVRKYFYPLITDYECYRKNFDSGLTPIALKVSREVLTLPLYGDLELNDVMMICSIILNMR